MLSTEAGRALVRPRSGATRFSPRKLWPLVLVALLLPLLWRSLVAAAQLRVDAGAWGDHTYLSGVNAIEESSTEQYRWTTGRAELRLPNLGGQYRVLRMRAHGWRPDGQPAPVVRLDVAGAPWGGIQTTPNIRIYNILLGPLGLALKAMCTPRPATRAKLASRWTGWSSARWAGLRCRTPGS